MLTMAVKPSANDSHERAEMRLVHKLETLHKGGRRMAKAAPAGGSHHHLTRAHHHLTQAHHHLKQHSGGKRAAGPGHESSAEHAKAGRAAHHRGRKMAAHKRAEKKK